MVPRGQLGLGHRDGAARRSGRPGAPGRGDRGPGVPDGHPGPGFQQRQRGLQPCWRRPAQPQVRIISTADVARPSATRPSAATSPPTAFTTRSGAIRSAASASLSWLCARDISLRSRCTRAWATVAAGGRCSSSPLLLLLSVASTAWVTSSEAWFRSPPRAAMRARYPRQSARSTSASGLAAMSPAPNVATASPGRSASSSAAPLARRTSAPIPGFRAHTLSGSEASTRRRCARRPPRPARPPFGRPARTG